MWCGNVSFHINRNFTCHVGGIWAPKPNAGNILSLNMKDKPKAYLNYEP